MTVILFVILFGSHGTVDMTTQEFDSMTRCLEVRNKFLDDTIEIRRRRVTAFCEPKSE